MTRLGQLKIGAALCSNMLLGASCFIPAEANWQMTTFFGAGVCVTAFY